MRFRIALFVASVALTAGWSLVAHHSFAAEFDGSKAIRLTGALTKIEWTNPHSYFYLDVNESGTIVKWTWDFGDGQKATVTSGAEQIHRYVDFGSYQVTLTVEDSQGPVKEYTREVIVQPPHRRATR